MDDPVLLDDWHPVAASDRVGVGTLLSVRLLDRELVLWRSSVGRVRAWQDRCPHRGTRLSIGRIEADELICAYHGWRFGSSGRCNRIPALPELIPPENACARVFHAEERYGLIWVCAGSPRGAILPFPEYDDTNLRKVLCGPYEVATSAPRIVENFLDMAHFPFVHAGILGEEPRNEVCDYKVGAFDDGAGGAGILATECFFWQPRTNSLAHGGTNVEYTYRVVRPLTAILTKIPEHQDGFREAISLHVQPAAEEASVVWIVLALTNFEQSEDELRRFQDMIFLQDKPIVENQVPKRLPLEQGAELPVRSDRMSIAYRAVLARAGPAVRRDVSALLIKNAAVLVTMDPARREIAGGSIAVIDDAIAAVGSASEVDGWIAGDPGQRTPQHVIDARGCVVLPGLVNCHHHLFQTLTRSIGTGEGRGLFDWLNLLYPIWGRLDPEAIYVSAKLALCELVLSGATTVADHLYLYVNGIRIHDEIAAARELGVRFHPTRGSMSVGKSMGGLPPDSVIENEEDILRESVRAIEAFHDPRPRSMLRIGIAPCSPFSVSARLMQESARLARSHSKVGLHTHLAETLDEHRYCMEKFGKSPLEYAESLDWFGEEVWFAHMVHPSDAEIGVLARTRSGVCHCPTSNMILASGIAPVRRMLDHGVKVGLGVDGSASNDGNHMLGEVRQAALLQRVGWPGFESRADRVSAREALELATLGGARVLQRDDIGSIEPGKAADVIAFRIDDIEHAGALGDPVAGLVTCTPTRAWLSVINGRVVVEDGVLRGVDLPRLIERHNAISLRVLRESGVV